VVVDKSSKSRNYDANCPTFAKQIPAVRLTDVQKPGDELGSDTGRFPLSGVHSSAFVSGFGNSCGSSSRLILTSMLPLPSSHSEPQDPLVERNEVWEDT
jgi:hypothetical protein